MQRVAVGRLLLGRRRAAIALLVAAGAGFAIAYLVWPAASGHNGLESEVSRLRTQVDELVQALDPAALASAAQAGAQVGSGGSEGARPERFTDVAGAEDTIQAITELVDDFENDRLLLAEIRKSPPRAMEEATVYWSQVKSLAVKSNVSLGPKVDRVVNHLPAYIEWLETSGGGAEASSASYVRTGANNYFQATDDFWQSVLLALIDRIDILVRVTDSR